MPTAQAQWWTLVFILATTLVVIVYDVLIIRCCGVDASISRVARRLFGAYPIIFVAVVFAIGILVGHIWLPSE